MTSFLGLIAALWQIAKQAPAFISLVHEIIAWVKRLEAEHRASAVADLHDAFSQVNRAQTPEEMRNAEANVANQLRRG